MGVNGNYASYKKINGDQIEAGTLGSGKFSESPTSGYGVKWFHGTPGACSSGCCCNWTVPSGISKLWIQAGVLVVTDLELATATDVITIWEVVEDFSTPRWSVLLLVVNILYALLVYIVVILETVVDVLDVHHMLMDTI